MATFSISWNARFISLVFILFLSSFFFITLVTVPALQINDEWITANQLHQLVQGHQVLTSEGKYGSYFGEISEYFESRSNILGYSLAVPIVSLLPMVLFIGMGDYFRFGILFFWTLIPVIIAAIIQVSMPEYWRWKKIPVFIPAILISLFLLFINLPFYYPFPSSIGHYPLESAALVFTSTIIFSLLSCILFLIGYELFFDKRKALFVAVGIISCSSYMYWGTSGKDHILSVFFFTLGLLFFFRWLKTDSRYSAFLGFFFLGLLAWVRPELGMSVCITLGLFFVIVSFYLYLKKSNPYRFLTNLTPLLGFFPGLIPFFLNNYFLTKNLFFPPFLQYVPILVSESTSAARVNPVGSGSSIVYEGTISETAMSMEFSFEHLISVLFKYYSLNSPNIITDLKGIFFFADNGSMPVAALCPFLILGLITLSVVLIRGTRFSRNDGFIIILCLCAILGIFLAYMRSMHGLHTSGGIAPDIRYLAPMYIPGGIIGIISIKYWKYSPLDSNLWKKSILSILIGVPVLLLGMVIINPFGGGFFFYNYTLSLCTFSLLIVFIMQYLVMEFFRRWNPWLIQWNLILLLVVPVCWQVMMVFLYSIAKFDGYTYWIPISELIVSSFIIPVT